ncbi:MAG: TldD/PmbA family protein [Bacteroidales bacterium]|nr:TldD/PmbA family protein [Candidatus Cryptobacteroides aphodequi]
MISQEELQLARFALSECLAAGAQGARVSLDKTLMSTVAVRDGATDRVSDCLDRAITFALFVDGRYGVYSTNKLGREDLSAFIADSVAMTRLLSPDPLRCLPESWRCCKDATLGNELGLCDPAFEQSPIPSAAQMSASLPETTDCRLLSFESEYSKSENDLVVLDSQGLFCRHTETAFEYYAEATVEDADGSKYNSYWWDSSTVADRLNIEKVNRTALERSVMQMHPQSPDGGKYTMVIELEAAARLLSPVLAALGGYNLQQGNSFLAGSEGKRIFCPGLNVVDEPFRRGEAGSRLFCSDGTAVQDGPIIENGCVRKYFLNDYIARKMKLSPTMEEAVRPHILPLCPEGKNAPSDCASMLELCGDGILVTGFNGGNSNPATGDFSFGVEGFRFEAGRIAYPVRGMLITGNLIDLWNSLYAAGTDVRPSMSKLIPTLAFSNVEFNA